MNHDDRWSLHLKALQQYADRYGDACPPTNHIEKVGTRQIRLGNWVSYMRSRYHKGLLPSERAHELEQFSTWTWGPVRPGPKSKDFITKRNQEIVYQRQNGMTLREIGDKYNLTRQRVHQIISGGNNE